MFQYCQTWVTFLLVLLLGQRVIATSSGVSVNTAGTTILEVIKPTNNTVLFDINSCGQERRRYQWPWGVNCSVQKKIDQRLFIQTIRGGGKGERNNAGAAEKEEGGERLDTTTSKTLSIIDIQDNDNDANDTHLLNGNKSSVFSIGILDLSRRKSSFSSNIVLLVVENNKNQDDDDENNNSDMIINEFLMKDDDGVDNDHNETADSNYNSDNTRNAASSIRSFTTIDDIVLRELCRRTTSNGSSSCKIDNKNSNGSDAMIIECLALLCDVLIIRTTTTKTDDDANDEMDCVIKNANNNNISGDKYISNNSTHPLPAHLMVNIINGNQQRKLVGMSHVQLWIEAPPYNGIGDNSGPVFRRINEKFYRYHKDKDGEEKEREREETDDDFNRCYSNGTTWSTLFCPSSNKGQNTNNNDNIACRSDYNIRQLDELFKALSRKVIRSKQCPESILKPDQEPKVSVKRLHVIKRRYYDRKVEQESSTPKRTELKEGDQNRKNSNTNNYSKRIFQQTQPKKQQQQQQSNDMIINDIMTTARQLIDDLEAKMQSIFLDHESSATSWSSSNSNNNPMPLLEFGSLIRNVLEITDARFQKETSDIIPDSFRRGLMTRVVSEVQRLYTDQLQALRNYYGQRYEAALDRSDDDDKNNDEDRDEQSSCEEKERKWAIAAQHMTTAFEAAAKNSAIPLKYRKFIVNDGSNNNNTNNSNDNAVDSSLDYVNSLQGLLRDMMDATERRKDDQIVASMLTMDDDEDTGEDNDTDDKKLGGKRRRWLRRSPPKWAKRIASRAIVFGVNYIQGWLAWQGIKRAAMERDRTQPKFPLF